MQIDLAALPNDPAILQQMLRDVIAAAAQEQGALQGAVQEREAENDKLRLLIQRLLRNRFGRRSEQLSPDQLQFGLEDLEQSIGEGVKSRAKETPFSRPIPTPSGGEILASPQCVECA